VRVGNLEAVRADDTDNAGDWLRDKAGKCPVVVVPGGTPVALSPVSP
jgi:hypothetical protein